jgi:hypothetical protein
MHPYFRSTFKGTSTTFTKVKGVAAKKFRPEEFQSFVEQLNSWSSRRDHLQRKAEQKKQNQANSRKKPLDRECAALKSDYNWALIISPNSTIIE